MLIMAHKEINARVEDGKLYWAKQTRFPCGAVEMAVTYIPETRLRWLNNELPRKPKMSPLGAEWAHRSKAEISAELERVKELEAAEKALRSKRSACARARQRVRFAVKSMRGDHLLTLSYRENMEDVERLKRDWQEYVRLVRQKEGFESWQFVAVPEKQERGAYHLHVAVQGRQDVKHLRSCWYRALGGTGKEEGAETPGQIDVKGPNKRWREVGSHGITWSCNKLSGYLTKYIGKTFDEAEKNAKRYWVSKGVKVEQVGYWLAAASYKDAVIEVYQRVERMGNFGLDVRARPEEKVIWLSASFRHDEPCPF